MSVFKAFVAATLSLTLALPAWAENRSAPVTAMFERLPLTTIDSQTMFELQYGNPRAAQPVLELATSDPERAQLYSIARGIPKEVASSLIFMLEEVESTVGFAMTDIVETASVEQLPDALTLYRFDDPAQAVPVGPALQALGYERTNYEGVPVWAKGDDYALDIKSRNHANPFGGLLGQMVRVAVDDDLLAWSPAWGPINAFAGGDVGLASHPQIAALIATLDAPQAGSGAVVGARFVIAATDLLGSPAVMSVDMVDGMHDVALLAVVAPPGISAETLAARIETNWSDRALPLLQAPMSDVSNLSASFVALPGEVPVVLVRLDILRPNPMFNEAYRVVVTSLIDHLDLKALIAP